MTFLDLLIIAVGVSMDAFSVAICKGLSLPHAKLKEALTVGLYFGLFQAIMPLIGYFAGSAFAHVIQAWDHWIAFVLLAILGIQMVREGVQPEACPVGGIRFREMIPLALATSIDALAVGVTLAFLNVPIFSTVSFIGLATFAFSAIGVYIGRFFGSRFQGPAQVFGGLVLMGMGLKILLEHTGIIG